MRYVLAAFLLLSACTCNGSHPNKNTPHTPPASSTESEDRGKQVTCPVCGLTFGRAEAEGSYTYKNVTYYFLIKDHRDAFTADPESYLDSK